MRRLAKLIGFLVLLVAHLAHGAISRTGSCSAATTSCTFSATATSDLKVVFAYRSASTTAPSLPAGWTTILTGSTAATGVVGSFRLGCNVSSSSGDTGTGTWTNASDVVGISYSGTAVGATANCNSTGIGGSTTANAKTSTAVTYQQPTDLTISGNSWYAGFAGNSAGGLCTPSGMTSVSSVGAGPAVIGNDTNAIADSYSATTCTATSGTWMTATAEIMGPSSCLSGNALCVNALGIVHGSTSTTTALTFSSVTSGHILAYGLGWTGSTITVSSIVLSGGCAAAGGFFTGHAKVSNSTTSSSQIGYAVLTTGGACTITVTFSSGPSASSFTVHEVNAAGFDCGTQQLQTAGSHSTTDSVTSGTCTTTQNGDYIFGFTTDSGGNGLSWTAGTSFSKEIHATPAWNTQSESRTQSTAGSIAATFTASAGTSAPITGIMAFSTAVAPNILLPLLGVGP